jgi:hypothetical protein
MVPAIHQGARIGQAASQLAVMVRPSPAARFSVQQTPAGRRVGLRGQ